MKKQWLILGTIIILCIGIFIGKSLFVKKDVVSGFDEKKEAENYQKAVSQTHNWEKEMLFGHRNKK